MELIEVFKKFQKERHSEDKGKNFNLLQDIYANTELFNLSLLSNNILSDKGKSSQEQISQVSQSYILTSDIFEMISLPFANCFSEIGKRQFLIGNKIEEETVYVFLREYSPKIVTGTVYFLSKIATRNIPFTIYNKGYAVLNQTDYQNATRFFGNSSINYRQLLTIVAKTVEVLTSLSKHSVAVDKPSSKTTEYYRKKHGTTIKVENRPIYYILDKSEEHDKIRYNSIKSRGTLEFSHSFKVRGHWREINECSIGKDRNGERKVIGFTWVTEYVKGEGDLIKKTRILK